MSSFSLYAATILIWGSTWYAIKLQLGEVEPIVSVAWRFALAAALLMGWCRWRGIPLRFSRQDHLGMAGLGLFLFSSNYAIFYYATGYVTSGLIAVVFSTIVIMNIVNGALLLGNRVSARTVYGAVVGIAGITLVFLPEIDGLDPFGLLLCLLGTLLASFGNMVSARNQRRGIPVVSANAWGMAYGTAFLLAAAAVGGASFGFETTLSYTASLLYLAVFGSVLAFGGYLTLLGRVGPERAAYVTVLFPVVALAISTLLEDYRWHAVSFLGVALVLFGNWLITRPEQPAA